MTILEAYEKAMTVVQELENSGIKLSTYTRRAKSLPMKKRTSICFSPRNQTECDLIYKKQGELCKEGIYFDSGGGFGAMEWEFDWSFHLKKT